MEAGNVRIDVKKINIIFYEGLKMTLTMNGVTILLKDGGPGAYTPESVKRTIELTEDLIRKIGMTSRRLADNAEKKRVTEAEIKLAAEFLLK